MAGGLLGSIPVHQWQGPAPAPIKSQVDLIYRPGQSIASAKVLPNQSNEFQFRSLTFASAASAHSTADGFRALIGTVISVTYHGVSYGNMLVKDVTVEAVETLGLCAGVNPDGSGFSFNPGARILARWTLVRLS